MGYRIIIDDDRYYIQMKKWYGWRYLKDYWFGIPESFNSQKEARRHIEKLDKPCCCKGPSTINGF